MSKWKPIIIVSGIFISIVVLMFFLIILIAGYKLTEGYWKAGTWENDSINYERAFGSPQPKEIEVVKSKYIRYPHFTLEQEMYFEFVMSDSLTRNWINNGWEEVPKLSQIKFIEKFKMNKPEWFMNDSISRYKIFKVTEESFTNPYNLVSIDTISKHVFYCSVQL